MVPLMNLAYVTPLLCGLAVFCLLPVLAPSLARLHATRMVLGTVLLVPLTIALYFKPAISPASAALLSIAWFCAACITAPMVDRARSVGAVLAATIGGIAALVASMAYVDAAAPLSLFTFAMITALLIGFAGSALLPMSPLRHTSSGATRYIPSAQMQLFAGWALLAAAILLLADQLSVLRWVPVLVSGLSAALFMLMTRAQTDMLQKTGEALVAGVLIALAAKLTPEVALLSGVLAVFCVNRGEAVCQALRLDDPLHMAGALFAPLILGTLLPGVLDMHLLAPACAQLGYALAVAALVSVILWPVVMIFAGLALPTRLAREGVHRP